MSEVRVTLLVAGFGGAGLACVRLLAPVWTVPVSVAIVVGIALWATRGETWRLRAWVTSVIAAAVVGWVACSSVMVGRVWTPLACAVPARAFAWGLLGLVGTLLGVAAALSPRRAVETLVIDQEGVRRTLRSGAVEVVRWEHLTEVTLRTTCGGPDANDVYWLLRGTSGGVAVSSAKAPRLLERLQRLSGFDNREVVRAMGSSDDGWFWCWRGQPGDGEVCRAEHVPEG